MSTVKSIDTIKKVIRNQRWNRLESLMDELNIDIVYYNTRADYYLAKEMDTIQGVSIADTLIVTKDGVDSLSKTPYFIYL